MVGGCCNSKGDVSKYSTWGIIHAMRAMGRAEHAWKLLELVIAVGGGYITISTREA